MNIFDHWLIESTAAELSDVGGQLYHAPHTHPHTLSQSLITTALFPFSHILQDTILAQQDDFYEFRERVQELIKDVVFICGSKLCFEQMAHVLQTPDVTKNWNLLEAALFIMQSVAKNLVP